MKAKELLDEIEREDNLPSPAGIYFRMCLGYEDNRGDQILGYREMIIVSEWLKVFVEQMVDRERQKVQDYYDNFYAS